MESRPQNPEFRNNPKNFHPCCKKIIRIYHECGIEKYALRITVWHQEACQVMKTDPNGQGFFFPTLTKLMNSFFLLTNELLF